MHLPEKARADRTLGKASAFFNLAIVSSVVFLASNNVKVVLNNVLILINVVANMLPVRAPRQVIARPHVSLTDLMVRDDLLLKRG